jgi:hypothetical protein
MRVGTPIITLWPSKLSLWTIRTPQHLIIGLNRDNINSLLDGDVFRLPKGIAAAGGIG